MTTVTQKTIKIGTSVGVTIPAKEVKRQGIHPGDEVKVTFERIESKVDDILAQYEKFKAQYGETLKNLADR